jgi:hypothetical protein
VLLATSGLDRLIANDALCNERGLESASVHLMELIEASPGLPPLHRCIPDEGSVVWLPDL